MKRLRPSLLQITWQLVWVGRRAGEGAYHQPRPGRSGHDNISGQMAKPTLDPIASYGVTHRFGDYEADPYLGPEGLGVVARFLTIGVDDQRRTTGPYTLSDGRPKLLRAPHPCGLG